MKTHRFLLKSIIVAAISASLLLLTSCGLGKIWDFTPIVITLNVCDSDGNNLLDENVPGNILDNKIVATFKGVEYPLYKSILTKMYMPEFFGLQLSNGYQGRPVIKFGELAGEQFLDDKLVIDWGDGTSDTIDLYSKCRWILGEPKFTRRFKLNGEKNEGTAFTIVK